MKLGFIKRPGSGPLVTGRAVLPALASALLGLSAHAGITPEVVAEGLTHPWALAFIGNGEMLVTERPGRMRVVYPDGRLSEPLAGLPAVATGGQGGLLDVVTDRDFAQNRTIYFCFAEPGAGGNSTALARARLSDDKRRLEQVKLIFSQKPKVSSNHHFGCRIVEAPNGTLFLTLGERFSRMADAQSLDNHHGKVVRINKDGSVPDDNPFVNRADALPEIWSYGHRNPQGATLGPSGNLWVHEHGPQGGDEINLPQPGRNYGWPLVSHGVHYGGREVGDGSTQIQGVVPPLYHWTPSIAPSGMALLDSTRYGSDWQGNLFVGALAGRHLVRLRIGEGNAVIAEEKLLEDYARIRDVRAGPDGLLYLLTDESNGRLVRLLPD